MKFFHYLRAEGFRVLRSFPVWIVLSLGVLLLGMMRFSGVEHRESYLQMVNMLVIQMHGVIALLLFAPFFKSSHQYRTYLLRSGNRTRMVLGDLLTSCILTVFAALILGGMALLLGLSLPSNGAEGAAPVQNFLKSLGAYSLTVMLLYPFISLLYAVTKSGAAATSLSVILQFILPGIAMQLRFGERLVHKIFNLIYWLSPSTHALLWLEHGRIENAGWFSAMLTMVAAFLAANLVLIRRRSY